MSLMSYSRRAFMIAAGAGAAATTACAQSPRPTSEVRVYKTPTCGCCTAWVDHMRAAGFSVQVHERPDLRPVRASQQVPDALAACHTSVIGGYALEGHVPAQDVRRLLVERPDAIGLAVPAMPLGSPGMEMPDGRAEAYDTLLMLRGGGTRVFASHG